MSMTDPIADMLTRIRNSSTAKHEKVDIPASKFKVEVAQVLKEEGYIKNFKHLEGRGNGYLRIYLKYVEGKKCAIRGIERVSKPGCRVYSGVKKIPRVRNGLGICILTTSQGLLTDRVAREKRLGGEVLCRVW